MTFTVNIESIQASLDNLGLHNVVDAQAFYNELEQQAAKSDTVQRIPLPPPSLTPFRWTAVLTPEYAEHPPSGTVSAAEKFSPLKEKQRQIMLKETRAMLDREAERFKHTPITSPLLHYDLLRFVCFSSITVFSSNREHNQVFKDSWCTWDFSAPFLCMLAADCLDESVKEGVGEDALLPMDLVMWGSSTTVNGNVTIQPASQMPQQTTGFIFGRKFADLLRANPVLPIIEGESQV